MAEPAKKTPAKPAPAKAAPVKAAPPKTKASPKPAPNTPSKPATKGSLPGAPPQAGTGRKGNPYDIILHPLVTEKTMFNMDKNNALEFLVRREANKPAIAAAIEELCTVKVAKVTPRNTKDGKRAVVRFAEGFSAEDIGMRVGVF